MAHFFFFYTQNTDSNYIILIFVYNSINEYTMKQLALIACFLLNVAYTQAQEKMIEQPPFSDWSSTSIEVDKVALSDTATVLPPQKLDKNSIR